MALTLNHALKVAILSACSLGAMGSASAFSLQGTVWDEASARGVDPYLLYAIALAESKKTDDGDVRPWPWAVNVAGKGYWFNTRSEAERFVDRQISNGVTNMDIGLLQVNLRWNGHRVDDPKSLFDISTAVRVGADILAEAIASAPHDPALAVGRYHHWNDHNRARAYGVKVLEYRKLMTGEW